MAKDELKDLGGWKSRVMVDRYAKCATKNLVVAAARIECTRSEGDVVQLSTFSPRSAKQRASSEANPLMCLVGRVGVEPTTYGLRVRCSTS